MKDTKDYRKIALCALLVFAAWMFVALVFAINHYAWYKTYSPEKAFSFESTFTLQAVSCFGWVLLTPIIFGAARRFLPEGKAFYRNIGYLIATGIAVILLQTLYQAITLPFLGYPSKLAYTSFPEAFRNMVVSNSLLSFSLFAITLGILLVSQYYKKFQERELANSRLEANLTHSRLKTLKMQLHPHFLFNTHNAISELVYTDPQTADKMIANLSDLLRISIENLEIEEVTLQQELSFVEKYIEIEQMRFQERLKFKLKIAPETLDAIVPNMILQPLIENAVRHGITPLREGGTVQISSSVKNGKLYLQVMDNGVGLPEGGVRSLTTGIGLSNIRERLFYLYEDNQKFKIGSNNKNGFSVSLEMPLRKDGSQGNPISVLNPEMAG